MWSNNSHDMEEEAGAAVSFDPFADLLLGLIAIIVPLISLLLASNNGITGTEESARAAHSADNSFVIVANAQGLVLPALPGEGAPVEIALRQILDDARLVHILQTKRDRQEDVSLRIEPDGLESAFMFEVVAAQNGPATILQTRVKSARGRSTNAGGAQ